MGTAWGGRERGEDDGEVGREEEGAQSAGPWETGEWRPDSGPGQSAFHLGCLTQDRSLCICNSVYRKIYSPSLSPHRTVLVDIHYDNHEVPFDSSMKDTIKVNMVLMRNGF